MRNLLYMSFLFLMISFLSCSQPDDYIEDYFVEYEHTVNDTTSHKDSTDNVSNLHVDSIIVVDTITDIVVDTISDKDDVNNTDSITQNQTKIKKDTFVVSYEKYMNISTSFGNEQGGACYDKYFFQGYAGNAAIGVFDLEKKSFICKIDILEPSASASIHVNTINFGSQRMHEEDFFPLLYVCSGYPQNINGIQCSFIYVYRIIKDNMDNWDAKLVQTITLKDFGNWTEGIIDNDHNYLWVKYNGYTFASFPIPKLENSDITIHKEDKLTLFSLEIQPFSSSNQGHLYHDDKILLVSGISPNTQKLAYIVINTLTQTRELVIDLAEIGLREEPENVFFYKNQLMIGYRKAIYKFNVRPLNNN